MNSGDPEVGTFAVATRWASWNAREYVPPSRAESWKDSIRFGNPADFSLLFSDDKSQRNEYFVGLLSIGILLATAFLIWIITQAFCMFRKKHERVGFWSGRPFRETPEQTQRPWYQRRPQRARAVYFVFGAIYMTSAFLMVSQGVLNLQGAANRLTAVAFDVDTLSAATEQIMNVALINTVRDLILLRDQFEHLTDYRGHCPTDPALDGSVVGQLLIDATYAAIRALAGADDISEDRLEKIKEAFVTYEKGAANVGDYSEEVDLMGWRIGLVLGFYSLVPVLLMAGVVFAAFQVQPRGYQRAVDWFILPLFIIMTVVAVFIAMLMSFGAALNADFCLPGGVADVNSPDGTIRQVMLRDGYGVDSVTFQIVDFYIRQCQEDVTRTPLVRVLEISTTVDDVLSAISDLINQLRAVALSADQVFVCGGDFRALAYMVEFADVLARNLKFVLADFLGLTRCENIVPVYLTAVNDGVCLYSTEATSWIFATGFTMAICGIIMISLLSVHKLTVLEDDVGNEAGIEGAIGPDGEFLAFPEFDGSLPPKKCRKAFTMYCAATHLDVRLSLDPEDVDDKDALKAKLDEGWQELSEDERDFYRRWAMWDRERWKRDSLLYNQTLDEEKKDSSTDKGPR